jgi:hypothetical protein
MRLAPMALPQFQPEATPQEAGLYSVLALKARLNAFFQRNCDSGMNRDFNAESNLFRTNS